MQISGQEAREAFAWWLRTGRWRPIRLDGDLELKFNPYHDPANGRFTSGPNAAGGGGTPSSGAEGVKAQPAAHFAGQQEEPNARGSNSRAFEDPMTLEQAFPGLDKAPTGAVVAMADNLLDLTGPANAMTIDVLQNQAAQLSAQIKAIDPAWHYDGIGPTDASGTPIVTVAGLNGKVNDLRFERAALIARVEGDYGPLQVETLRFIQQRADDAYEQAQALLQSGRLNPRLSREEALGNYVDQQVRLTLRERYGEFDIDSAGAGPVRVNRREYDSSGIDLSYRRPDAGVADVADVAFDVTLSRKTLGTAQVRGFFSADFSPSRVAIIRPRQLGVDHTYVISRPEAKQ